VGDGSGTFEPVSITEITCGGKKNPPLRVNVKKNSWGNAAGAISGDYRYPPQGPHPTRLWTFKMFYGKNGDG